MQQLVFERYQFGDHFEFDPDYERWREIEVDHENGYVTVAVYGPDTESLA